MSSRQVVKKIFANFENSNDGANIRQGITKWVSYFLSQYSKKNLVPSPSNFIYIFFSFWVNSGVTMSYWTRSCRLLNFLVILITLAMCNLKFVILIFLLAHYCLFHDQFHLRVDSEIILIEVKSSFHSYDIYIQKAYIVL